MTKISQQFDVLLFYKIISLKHPEALVKRHREVCKALQLCGRALIGRDGVNGTVAGTKVQIELYKDYMNQHRYFCDIDFKESTSTELPFSKMMVKARKEIITTDVRESFDLCRRGNHIDRDTFHKWFVRGEDMVILDMRNDYEWEIGRFVGSVRPPMKYFRDLKDNMNFYNQYKGKKIVMFCTGGIRCEPASAYFLANGFHKDDIYQLEGGIVKYAEKYANDGFYEGKCFVFDDRMALPVNTTQDAVTCGFCVHCNNTCDIYHNCANRHCNKLFLGCNACSSTFENTCSDYCKSVTQSPSEKRPAPANHVKVLHRNK